MTVAPLPASCSCCATLELRPPEHDERRERSPEREIRRRDRLGGLIHEYYQAAA